MYLSIRRFFDYVFIFKQDIRVCEISNLKMLISHLKIKISNKSRCPSTDYVLAEKFDVAM